MTRAALLLPLLLVLSAAATPATAPEAPAPAPGSFPAGHRDTREVYLQEAALSYAGTAEDDLFFLAAKADLSGTFEDDVIGAASASIRFTGHAREDVRMASLQTLVFDGAADASVTLWATTVELSTNAVIKGDAHLSGAAVTSTGRVEGDLVLEGAETATLKGFVGGSVRIASPDIAILPGTSIGGDLVVAGNREVALPAGVTLAGELRQEAHKDASYETMQRHALLLLFVTLAFTGLAIGLLQLGVMPLSTQIAAQLLRVSWPQCMMAGGLVLGVSMVMVLIGFKLGLGIVFAAVVLAALALLLFTGQTAMALMIGHRLAGARPIRSWAALAAITVMGLLLLQLAFLIPVIGTSLWLVLNFQGAGAIFVHLRQTQKGAALAAHQAQPPPLPGQTPNRPD
jgi:cytoskeletal protein CcmA (bactofilin family)